MNTTMKLLIQGCGYIGQVHLKTIRNNNLCDVAICETNPARLQEVAKKFGVSETYASLD
jgi:predicted dehydrogenase